MHCKSYQEINKYGDQFKIKTRNLLHNKAIKLSAKGSICVVFCVYYKRYDI